MPKLILFCLLFFPFAVWAEGYQVRLHVNNLPETARPVLLRMYNGNLFIVDSLPTRTGDELTFRVPEKTSPCMLRSVLGFSGQRQRPDRQVNLDFLFNKENIELRLDFNAPYSHTEVLSSLENKVYFDFLQTDARYLKKLSLIEQVVLNYPDSDEFYTKALEYYPKLQHQRDKIIDKIYASHPKTLAGRIIKNQKLPVLKGELKGRERDSVFRAHFLKQLDFNDTTLLYTNVYTDKVFRYIQMSLSPQVSPRQNEANCIRALDALIPLLEVNPVIQQHILQFLVAGFESMHMEEVLAHISSNYLQQCGSSSEIIKRRLEGYRKMAVGQKVPDFIATDIQGNTVNLYNELNPYTLLLFWHTGCSHCQLMMKELPELEKRSQLFSKKQIKIIGISIDEQKEEWEKFSSTFPLEWTNTHIEGSFENPIASAYNLFATPTLFLIDTEYNILAKPTTLQELIQNISELK